MLSTDGANKNPLAHPDYMSSAFASNDFHGLNLDNDNFFPDHQHSPTSKFLGDVNGHGGVTYDSLKVDNELSAAGASLYSSVYQNVCSYPSGGGATDMNFAFNPVGGNQYHQMNNYSQIMGSSKPIQYGPTDLESLQQKISMKKQSLDILQGVLPDPLGLESSHLEKRYITNTERIQVPSSDHVAEIVGKNGQRIKQLREQLKVWVKTPSRDEPPIFEVTGLPEKLAEAKCTILRMSEHFTKVQQERMHRVEPNRIEDRLYVDQDKVGLIVGASGQTIRWVQQLSDTHIATPRKQESIPGLPPPQTFFTICGTPEKVKFAKQLICEYVTLRCQGLWLDPDLDPSAEASKLVRDFHQRRQVEDSHRKPAAGAEPPAFGVGGGGVPLRPALPASGGVDTSMFAVPPPRLNAAAAGGGILGDAAGVRQLISEMESMWCSGTAAGAINKHLPPPPSSASPTSFLSAAATAWNPMLYQQPSAIDGGGDRRFSAADVSASTDFGQFNNGGAGPDYPLPQPPQKKFLSDELVQQMSPQMLGPGWM